MAVIGTSGYITTWDPLPVGSALEIVKPASGRRAINFPDDGQIVKPRIITLGNGTKVHYDGIVAAPLTPGTVTQELFVSSGALAWLISMKAYLGQVGDLVMVDADTSSFGTAQGILTEVKDITPVDINRTRMWISLTWEMLELWT